MATPALLLKPLEKRSGTSLHCSTVVVDPLGSAGKIKIPKKTIFEVCFRQILGLVTFCIPSAFFQLIGVITYPNEETLQAYLSGNEVPLCLLSGFSRSAGVAMFFNQT